MSVWKPCPRDKTYTRPPVIPTHFPWLIASLENFLAWQFFTSHECVVDNPLQSLNNMSRDSAIPHAVHASQLCRSTCPVFLSKLCIHAIKAASQPWLVTRLSVIEGLRVTHWAHLQTVSQVRGKGYSSNITDLLFSGLVPVGFSGSKEVCLIPSFGSACNPVVVVVVAAVEHGRIGGWRCHWVVPLRQIFPDKQCCMCVDVDGDRTSQRRLIKG